MGCLAGSFRYAVLTVSGNRELNTLKRVFEFRDRFLKQFPLLRHYLLNVHGAALSTCWDIHFFRSQVSRLYFNFKTYDSL